MTYGLDTGTMGLQKVVAYMANDLNPMTIFQRCLQCWAYVYRVVDWAITVVNRFIQQVVDDVICMLNTLGKSNHLLVNVGSVLLDRSVVKMVSEFATVAPQGRSVFEIRNGVLGTGFIHLGLGIMEQWTPQGHVVLDFTGCHFR